MWQRLLGLVALTSAVAWMSVGCAQERDPINRVQAGALEKKFFVGQDLSDPKDDPEFYMRNTVVDVPYGSGQDGLFTASYAQPVNRIKWEITEKALIGRSTFERVQDTDHYGARFTNKGQVVAMFEITSHFDVRSEYNPQTGEDFNLIAENVTDRPWYQRAFMRVNWKRNMVTDGYEVDTLSQAGIFGAIKYDPIDYFVEDPRSPDAPVFDAQEGYFDVTTKSFATPQIVETEWGDYPACWFIGEHPVTSCNATEITLRLSFRRVTDTDFEPTHWDGNKMDAFGWFYDDRYGYDRNYGIIDEKWFKLAAKYNIWQRSHIEGSQCGVDYWRDEYGQIASYRRSASGAFLTDPSTGIPLRAEPGDATAAPFPGTPIGANANQDSATSGSRGTADFCEFKNAAGDLLHHGAKCDTIAHKCSLPLYERQLRTIPWYYGPESPADLFPATARALGQWNLHVKRAAMLGQKLTDVKLGGDGAAFQVDEVKLAEDTAAAEGRRSALAQEGKFEEAARLKPAVPDVFVLCHNPSITPEMARELTARAGGSTAVVPDPDACHRKDGDGSLQSVHARVGDLRYNMSNIITTPQVPSPWGIMSDAVDPLTGEIIATSVNEWAHVLDTKAQTTVDLMRWLNGEISDEQVTSGQYLRDWARATNGGTSQHTPRARTRAEIEATRTSITVPKVLPVSPIPAKQLQAMGRDERKALMRRLSSEARNKLGPSLDPQFEGMRRELIGTKFESMMVNAEDLEAVGLDPKTPTATDDQVMRRASPLRGGHPEMHRWLARQRAKMPGRTRSCTVEQPEPDGLVGLARHAARLYPLPATNDPAYPKKKHDRDRALFQWIREQFHIAVILHEMGHSMGLRHNFTGSWDALNYHPQYWQLRTNNGKERPCADAVNPHTDGTDCVGPRWVDPVTDAETNGLIWKWGSSTVMDYPGDLTQDMNDLGAYDKAAVRFMYGGVVDVDADARKGTPQAEFNLDRLDGFGGISGPLDFADPDRHYSSYQDRFKVLGSCTAQSDPKDPLSATCTGPKIDNVLFEDMKNDGSANFAVDPKNRVRHPYMFGSDEYADFGNMPVFRNDAGADAYEQFKFLETTYENRYVFNYFRRDRTTFNTQAVIRNTFAQYFDKFDSAMRAVALYTQLFSSLGDDVVSLLLDHSGTLLPHRIASSDSFATWARILTRPEPGEYYATGNFAEVPRFAPQNSTPSFTIPVGSGDGRYLHNDYDYTKGYGWSDWQKQVGSYYEKRQAIYYLLVAYNRFVQNSKDDYIDGRILNINYSTLYPEQTRRLFSALMQNDPSVLGAYVMNNELARTSGQGRVRYLPWQAAGDIAHPAGATVVSPLVGWEEQWPALLYGFYFGATTLTMDWVAQMRIFTPEGKEAVGISEAEQVRYTDPLTGLVYAARRYGTETVSGKVVERGSGARMLAFAADLAARTFQIESMSPMGEATYKRDSRSREPLCITPGDACEANRGLLKAYSANIDSARQLSWWYASGPLKRGVRDFELPKP